MPTYILHGFRWPRPLIRIHVVQNNIDDATSEWLIAPQTTRSLLENLRKLWPDVMSFLPNLRFAEQYDPLDEKVNFQPYAYVADFVHEVNLGINLDEVRAQSPEQMAALANLRNNLCPGEKVGWFVVVCGDEERWVPPLEHDVETNFHYRDGSTYNSSTYKTALDRPESQDTRTSGGMSVRPRRDRSNSLSNGFKRLFKSRSMRSLRHNDSSHSSYSTTEMPPFLPGTAR